MRAAALTVTGRLTGELTQPALIGGMVLIVMLIGFTVMQNAFASGGLIHGAMSDIDRRALALTGSGDLIFDWDVPPTASMSARMSKAVLACGAARWKDRRRTGSIFSIPSTGTAIAPVSTRCWNSGADASPSISGCARRTATITGTI